MSKTRTIRRALVLLAGLLPLTAQATMAVDRSIFYFEPGGSSRADVQVTNPDAEPMYVQVEVLEVVYPGTLDEQHLPVANPRSVDFLVTPNRFVVPPRSRKVVRLVNLGGHGEAERVLRINLKPVAPPMEAHRSGVRVLVAHQLLAVVLPQQPQPEIVAERVGSRLLLENRGNTNVLLRNGRACATQADLEGEDDGGCMPIEARRLYAGNRWDLDLAHSGPVEFVLMQAGEARRARY
jgi:P pilus assembly chaperone PapD